MLAILGFAPNLLKHIAQATKQSTPQTKLEYQGFLNLLMSNTGRPAVTLNSSTKAGHRKTVRLKYKQRFNVGHTDTAKSCDNKIQQPYAETEQDLNITRQIAIHLGDETIAQYQEDASTTVRIGQPSTGIMDDLLDSIKTGADAILSGINQDLYTDAAAALGNNRATGNANAKSVNFPLNTTNNDLNSGMTEITQDYQFNQAKGRPMMVGEGLPHSYFLQQIAKDTDQSGLNTRIQANQMDFFYDPFTSTALGANQSIVYEPEAVQLVEYMEYTGFKAGFPGAGDSIFFVMALPMDVNGIVTPVMFDVQLKYNSCEVTETDGYYGTSLTLQKGWSAIISKQCALWSIPAGAYRGTDPLNGNRGSYRYSFTNV